MEAQTEVIEETQIHSQTFIASYSVIVKIQKKLLATYVHLYIMFTI